MIETLKILWNKSNKKIKYQFLFLTIAVIFSSFAEVISLSSVIPFITALLNPENILNSKFIKFFPLDLSGFSTNSLILSSTLFLVFFSFLASLLKIFVLGTIRLWANNFGTNMATEIYEKILYQPYEEHLKIDSSHYISVVTVDTNDFINQLIVPLLNMVASSFIALSILMTLILINGWYSIFVFLIIFIFYLIALKLSGKSLKRLGFRKSLLRETVLKIFKKE